MSLYFGKISEQKGEQYEKDFYAAGETANSWYNGLEIGDFVLPIYKGQIRKLWKVKGYGDTPIASAKFEKNCFV